MKLKSILLGALSFVLVTAVAIGGTVAYLTSTDDDVNVMTLGEVKIEQIEQQLDKNGALEPFVQAKDLYPGTEVSKIVTVKNIGESDAYFRTLIAFEDLPDSETFGIDFPISEFGYTWSWGAPEATIVIDGVTYQVYEAVYNSALKAGETSGASLTKVELSKTATNEDMETLCGTYDILVLSQAVQTKGFSSAKEALDTAFGDVTSTTATEWFGGINVPVIVNENNIDDALANGDDIILDNNMEKPANNSNAYGKTAITVHAGQTIDGANNSFKALNAYGTWDSAINATGGTIKNLTVSQSFRGVFINHNASADKCGLVTLRNVVIDGPTYTISCDQGTGNGLEAYNCKINGWTSYAATIGNVKFIDTSFGEGAGYAYCRPYAPTEFVNCDFEAGYEMNPRAAVTFENCTIDGVALTTSNLSSLVTSNIDNASVK